MAVYGVLWAAAGSNTLARAFGVTVEGMMVAFQILLVVGPVAGFLVTRYICVGLVRREQDEALHGYETGIVIRSPEGGFTELHAPLPSAERALEGGESVELPVQREGDTRVAERA
jgi:ubiquinol-cytochrome c reductase cytochrome b subunit